MYKFHRLNRKEKKSIPNVDRCSSFKIRKTKNSRILSRNLFFFDPLTFGLYCSSKISNKNHFWNDFFSPHGGWIMATRMFFFSFLGTPAVGRCNTETCEKEKFSLVNSHYVGFSLFCFSSHRFLHLDNIHSPKTCPCKPFLFNASMETCVFN